MKTLIVALTLTMIPVAALAQGATEAAPPATCSTAMDTALAPAWSAWTKPEALTAAATPATQPELSIGHAYTTQLNATASVDYTAPLKKTKDGTFGGLFMLTIVKAGVYTVGVDQGAWVDMVRDTEVLKSVAHGHGPACSTIHKMVDFELTPGHYTLQLSNADKAAVTVEVIAK